MSKMSFKIKNIKSYYVKPRFHIKRFGVKLEVDHHIHYWGVTITTTVLRQMITLPLHSHSTREVHPSR